MISNNIMNIYNNLSRESKHLILVRKLKEAFISFTSDLLDVFPKDNYLFLQLIVTNQLPDTSLFNLLNKNINLELIENEDEYYLKYNLIMLKDYEYYLNEIYEKSNLDKDNKYFKFEQILNTKSNIFLFEENKEMIWKWLKIFKIMIKNINTLSK